jgi:Ca2+-binding RTX toxin-like protein
MYGGNGNDYMEGFGNFSTINEQFYGEAGNDTIISLGGNDILDGGSGRDRLQGGDGSDTLTGGAGKDAYIFLNRAEGGTTAFTDTITDFTHQDWIEFLGTGMDFSDLTITQSAADTHIQYTDNAGIVDTIVLTGVDSTTMEASDFAFA